MNEEIKASQGLVSPNTNATIAKDLSSAYKSFAAKPFSHRAAVMGVAGGVYGLITSDQKGESVIGTIMDAGISAGVAIGGESAVNYIIKNHSDQIKGFLDKSTGVSVGDYAKIGNEIDVDHMVTKMKARAGRAGWVTAGIGAFIGVTSLMGVANKLERGRDVQRMQNDAERAQQKKDKQDSQRMSEMFGYNKHQPMGQLVMDMWNDRMGHHKMGNAKFY